MKRTILCLGNALLLVPALQITAPANASTGSRPTDSDSVAGPGSERPADRRL